MTGKFSAADVCVSIWSALAMVKYGLMCEERKKLCGWIKDTLLVLKPFDEKNISKLLSEFEVGAVSNLVEVLEVVGPGVDDG